MCWMAGACHIFLFGFRDGDQQERRLRKPIFLVGCKCACVKGLSCYWLKRRFNRIGTIDILKAHYVCLKQITVNKIDPQSLSHFFQYYLQERPRGQCHQLTQPRMMPFLFHTTKKRRVLILFFLVLLCAVTMLIELYLVENSKHAQHTFSKT